MRYFIVIPARLSSKRLPNKVIADINGKPMIYYTYNQALKVNNIDDVIVATDSDLVMEVCNEYNIKAMLTSKNHRCGTDRVGEVAKRLGDGFYINLQADEPLIDPNAIYSIVKKHIKSPDKAIITLVKRIVDKDDISSPSVVKVVFDRSGKALYFSRSAIPYYRNILDDKVYYKHIGIYGYTYNLLMKWVSLPPGRLELIEDLEQLRIIENGESIYVVESEWDSIGVDTMEDLNKVRKIIRRGVL